MPVQTPRIMALLQSLSDEIGLKELSKELDDQLTILVNYTAENPETVTQLAHRYYLIKLLRDTFNHLADGDSRN